MDLTKVEDFKSKHSYLLAACIANLDKFNELGELSYKWVTFPTKSFTLENLYKEIGIGLEDSSAYQNAFIVDYQSIIPGLTEILGKLESLDELNYLAHIISRMPGSNYHTFCSFMQTEQHRPNSLEAVINLALPQNIKSFVMLHGVKNFTQLGERCSISFSNAAIAQCIEKYGSMENFGKFIAQSQNAVFSDYGCTLKRSADVQLKPLYTGNIEEIPKACRVIDFHPDLPEQHCKLRLHSSESVSKVAEETPSYHVGAAEKTEKGTESPEPEIRKRKCPVL